MGQCSSLSDLFGIRIIGVGAAHPDTTIGAHGGLAIWSMVPVPMVVVNGLFIKISPELLVSQILGWLIKLTIAASVFALIAR